MPTHKLKTPFSEQEIRKLHVNDILYISGTIVTARDQAHQRALKLHQEGKPLPVNLEDKAVYHCGPVMSKQDNGSWVVVSAGPTTSTRMDLYEDKFIENFGPRIIIGKGGMGKKTATAMAKYGAVYCAFTGGAAVLAAQSIRKVEGVEWLDLGMPEAMWILEVEMFGPLVVAIDSQGHNLFADVAQKVETNRHEIFQKFGLL
jgi:fumarate hydratase subunit beta